MTVVKKYDRAFLLIHLGLGDVILCNGMINYLSSFYESLVVVISDSYTETVYSIYNYNPKISFYCVKRLENICTHYGFSPELFAKITEGYDVYSSGLFKKNHVSFDSFPLSFYDDIKIPRSVFWTHSHVERTKEAIELYNYIKEIPYIFIANKCSAGFLFNDLEILTRLNFDKDTILILNPHNNIYSCGHKYYDIAQSFLTHRPLTHYTVLLENSYANILTDSSIYSLCHLLHIKTEYNYVITRGTDYSHLYDKKSYEKEDVPIRVKFQRIIV